MVGLLVVVLFGVAPLPFVGVSVTGYDRDRRPRDRTARGFCRGSVVESSAECVGEISEVRSVKGGD